MSPRFPVHDIADHRSVDVEVSGQFALKHAASSMAPSNLQHIIGRQLRASIALAAGEQSFRGAVSKVLTSGAIEQMIGANARAIIAVMATVIADCKRAFHRFIRVAVRHGWTLAVDEKHPVAEAIPFTHPQPTTTEFWPVSRNRAVCVDLSPEAQRKRDRIFRVLIGHTAIVPRWFTQPDYCFGFTRAAAEGVVRAMPPPGGGAGSSPTTIEVQKP